MAFDRFGRENTGGDWGRGDRDEFSNSGARDYEGAGELGGYGRENQRDYAQRDYAGRDYGRPEAPRQDYGQRDYSRQDYSERDYGQRGGGRSDRGATGYGAQDYGSGERQPFTGGSGYYRGDSGRQDRDTYRQSRGAYDRQPQRDDRDEGRGFMARAADEVRSWVGDAEAERRREQDARDAQGGRGGYGHDEHYHHWRNQQIAAFDRDYDEYRQENHSKFHNEFSSFRTERQSQRDLLTRVDEQMEVVGSDGSHVGTVDKVRGDRIILTKSDPDAGGHHHSIPSRWLQSADGGKLTLRKTAEQAKAHWRDEERQQQGGGAMFGGGARGQSDEGGRSNESGEGTGGTSLNRSFSGTY